MGGAEGKDNKRKRIVRKGRKRGKGRVSEERTRKKRGRNKKIGKEMVGRNKRKRKEDSEGREGKG